MRSPETYVGSERGANISSPGGAALDERRVYEAPASLRLNELALSGDWTVGRQDIVLNEAGGRITYRFHARDLHLDMGSTPPGKAVRFHVFVDGEVPGDAHGLDINADGDGVIDEPRLYQLLRQPGHIKERTFEIQFDDPGAQAYVFTFG